MRLKQLLPGPSILWTTVQTGVISLGPWGLPSCMGLALILVRDTARVRTAGESSSSWTLLYRVLLPAAVLQSASITHAGAKQCQLMILSVI